jgi:hypothetical protein
MSSHCASLQSDHLSTLLFIKLVGSPLSKFNPDEYVKMWLLSGRRHAEETACRKEEMKEENSEYNSLWDIL